MAKKILKGTIRSNKMQNTVVVEVERKVAHPIYKKIIRKTKGFLADINGMELAIGDVVKIEETRPMSKNKHFKVIGKVEKEIK